MGIRRHKFNAKKQETEDGKFDSKKELKVWEELKLLQQCGEISELTRVRKDCTFDLHGLDPQGIAPHGRRVPLHPKRWHAVVTTRLGQVNGY